MEILKNPQVFSSEEVLKILLSREKGLSEKEVSERQKIFGKNILEEEKINHFKIFFRQFANILIYVLIAAAIISFFAGKWIDFFSISIIVIINTILGFWQELKAEISLKELKKLTESKETVLREGQTKTVFSSELVPGDIVLLFEGSVITADIRLVESSNLVVDESSLTGESIPVSKDSTVVLKEDTSEYDQVNMLLAGTNVVKGIGRGIVVKTGRYTYFSNIAEKAKEASPQSPVTKAIKYFAKYYTYFIIVVLFFIGIYGYLQGRDLLNISYILVAQLVSAVPAGLPLVISLTFVFGAIALSKKKTLVRYLPAVETLGSATVIATDKTGTITEGKIEVHSVFLLDEKALKLVALLCNDAYEGRGDPIDISLTLFSKDLKKEDYPRIWSHGFDVKRRMMITAHEIEKKQKILVKGAFEELQKIAKNKKDFLVLEKELEKMSSSGLRVLAFGIGDFESKKIEDLKITIVGLIGFLDPPKKNVKMAVIAAQEAGIKVIMITGDYPLTAKAIAKEVGIYRKNDLIITGEEIAKLSSKELYEKLKKATVLARILPEHKYEVVKSLQENGEIVVVSGDGVNDVPALKVADLGIAMGSGTEVAKSVSKMILLDNNLEVIVDAIKNGRVIADNIRKVIYYLLSTSVQEIFFVSLAIIEGLPLPLVAVQILWINLVTDGVEDKTFPFAKEEGNVMKRAVKKPIDQFFDKIQIFRIAYFGFALGFILYELFKYLVLIYPYEKAITISFACIVVAQWFNGIQSQQEKEPFFKNIKKSITINPYIFLGIVLGIFLLLMAIYSFPALFHLVPMKLYEWKYPFFISIVSLLVVEVRKWCEIFFQIIKRKNN
jgi:P-type Ca2+ transporter type 2C